MGTAREGGTEDFSDGRGDDYRPQCRTPRECLLTYRSDACGDGDSGQCGAILEETGVQRAHVFADSEIPEAREGIERRQFIGRIVIAKVSSKVQGFEG